MKITELRYRPYNLPFARPFQTTQGSLVRRQGFVVGIRDEEGRWGTGEAAPLDGFGMEPLDRTRKALAAWARELLGKELETDFPADRPPPAAFGLAAGTPWAGCPGAICGLETALLDLAAQRRGIPLARLLHPRAAARVEVNGLIGAQPAEEAARSALQLVGEGFCTLKIKLTSGTAAGGSPMADPPQGEQTLEAEDIRRVKAVRDAVGGAIRLRVDAGGGWNEKQAYKMVEALTPYAIEYVEQPLPPPAIAAMARMVRQSPIRIAADESLVDLEEARRILENWAAHLLIVKPMALGGALTAMEMARLAEARGIPVVVTSLLEGIYGRLMGLHVAAAVQALPATAKAAYACGLATGTLLLQDLADPLPIPKDGGWTLPETPGLGLDCPFHIS